MSKGHDPAASDVIPRNKYFVLGGLDFWRVWQDWHQGESRETRGMRWCCHVRNNAIHRLWRSGGRARFLLGCTCPVRSDVADFRTCTVALGEELQSCQLTELRASGCEFHSASGPDAQRPRVQSGADGACRVASGGRGHRHCPIMN